MSSVLRGLVASTFIAGLLQSPAAGAEFSRLCTFEYVLFKSWISTARAFKFPPFAPKTERRTETPIELRDKAHVTGYSYATKHGLIEEEFVLILQGNAMMAERVAQLADEVADRTSRRVYVFAYRGYGNDEQEVPSTGALLGDTVEVVARLFGQSGTRKGVLVGISMGGIFALHAAKQLPHLNLHLLLDSVPARIPTVFVSLCPKYLDPIEMLSDELIGRTGIIYSESDPNYTGVADADRMIGRIRSRSTFVEKVDTAHAELSPRGVLVRAPLYAKYIDGKASR